MNYHGQGEFNAHQARDRLNRIRNVLLVGSGKGGVGKSFVACGLALSLSREGYRTGVFDIDLHGASIASYLGARPPIRSSSDGLEPKIVRGVKVMSIALLTGSNPVPMRGGGKEGLITQFFAITNWGVLDYLVVDLPPSTGDELFSAFKLFPKSSLILVTTLSRTAVDVVSRLRRLARTEGIPVAGVVLNMAFIKRGERKLYPFGKPDVGSLRRALDSSILAELPLDPAVSSGTLLEVLRSRKIIASAFDRLIKKVAVDSGLSSKGPAVQGVC